MTRIAFPDDAWDELARRLADRRPPAFPFADRWTFGTGLDVVREVVDRWAGGLDRRAFEARCNAHPYDEVSIDGVTTGVYRLRGETSGALPLVLTHGWPSTVLENLHLADLLAHPSRSGGDPADAFDVVVPALPGFPLAAAPADPAAYSGLAIADRWAALMTACGHDRFVASGGDIGARVTTWLGARHGDRVLGIHVSSNALAPALPGHDLTPDEAAWVAEREEWIRTEAGYIHLQGTKPLSLAYGLSESPAALAAWIVEKWAAWTATDDVVARFGADLTDQLTLYWLTNRIATSFLPYYASVADPPSSRPWGLDIEVPVSLYLCPDEIGGIPPRAYADRQFRVARWTEFERGGHFPAVEQPDVLAADIRAAFRPLRVS
jgi:pimeloyl-ACP methyl ester carboxylesterase